MKTLLLSLAIALVGIIATFHALLLVGFDKSVAGSIAMAIVGGIPYIRDSLDKEGLPRARRTGRTILSFEGFGLSLRRVILNGTLIVFAAMNLSTVFGGAVAAASKVTLETGGAPIAKALAAVVVFPTVFLVGRWVGRRSIFKGIIAIFLICVFARVTSSLIDLALTTPEKVAALVGMAMWQQVLLGTALLFLVGCWGYWRGRRQRLAAYLTYLLRHVSTATREAIVELAFAEATREEAGPHAAHEKARRDTTPHAPAVEMGV